jgi:hypothetical protein
MLETLSKLLRSPALRLALALAICGVGTAQAHSWYPHECCHDDDCAPVDNVLSVPDLDGIYVTSKHGSALVPASFPRRPSPDSRMHVCLRKAPGGTHKLICVFMPPES